jgi:hypothetical protein
LRAAEESASAEKLILLAISLATAARAEADADVDWELSFVSALDGLGQAHIQTIKCFLKTANQLGLGNGTDEFDNVPEALNRVQLVMGAPHLEPILDPVLATLERQGLVRTTAGASVYDGSAPTLFRLTDFGGTFVKRIREVGHILGLYDTSDLS